MMKKYTLAVNAGSSSLKCRLFQNDGSEESGGPKEISVIKVTGLNSENVEFGFDPEPKNVPKPEKTSNHEEVFRYILQQVGIDRQTGDSRNPADLVVAHRVVHGGAFENHLEINQETYHELQNLKSLAPLHNAPALAIIKTCLEELPEAKNIAFFDTSFHRTMSAAARSYAIDQEVAEKKGLRKYGFHGISYQYILHRVASFLDKRESSTNLIVLHLGSGCSACAIRNGKSIDNSMGLTPVSGLPGASRSGDIDPCLIFHYTSSADEPSHSSTKGLHISKAEDILNVQSGWRAITGTSDFSQIATPDAEGPHRLAFDMFVHNITGYVGSYFVKLDGKVDALVFSGGIGESSGYLRAEVIKRLQCLGFGPTLENHDGDTGSLVREIGSGGIKVLVCRTDEEAQMAQNVFEILHKTSA